MSPSFKIRSLLAPAAFVAVAALAPTTASADAVAQAYLDLTNFGLTTTGVYTVGAYTDSGDVSASINGGVAATAAFNATGAFTLNQSVGPNAGSYAPLTALVGAPTQNYVGSYSFLNGGNPATSGVQAAVDDTVSLHPGGVGTAQSNTNLTATFLIDVLSPGAVFTVAFDANAFWRTMLSPFGASGTSNAAYSWDILVRDASGAQVFYWAPDGAVNTSIFGGTENADGFDLSQGAGINFGGFDFSHADSGRFSATTNPFVAGIYSLTIQHNANADATMRVPEPDALSLLALGLLGLGFIARRRNQV